MRYVSGLSGPPTDVDLDALREAVERDEVELAILFGSYATADQGPLSDLDLAVRFEPDVTRARKLALLDDLTVTITDATGIEAIDLIDLDAVGPAVGYAALSEGTLVYGDRSAALDLECKFLLRRLDFQPVKHAWDQALETRLREDTYGRS